MTSFNTYSGDANNYWQLRCHPLGVRSQLCLSSVHFMYCLQKNIQYLHHCLLTKRVYRRVR